MSITGGISLRQTLSLTRQAIELARIRGLVLKYGTAINDGDLDTAMACYADTDDISLVSVDAIYWGRAAVRAFLARVCGPEQLEKITKLPLDARITLQGHMALICSEHAIDLPRADRQPTTARMSLVLVHDPAAGWRILGTHLSGPRAPYLTEGVRPH